MGESVGTTSKMRLFISTIVISFLFFMTLTYQACSKQGFEVQLKKTADVLDPFSIEGLVLGDNSAMASTATDGVLSLDQATFFLVGYPLQSGYIFDFNAGSSDLQALRISIGSSSSTVAMSSSIDSSQKQIQQSDVLDFSKPIIVVAQMNNKLSDGRLYVNGYPSSMSTATIEDYYESVSRTYKVNTQNFQLVDMVVYNKILSVSQIAGITAYYSEKWKVPSGDLEQTLTHQTGGSTQTVNYASDIAPIFSNRCNSCHGGDVTGVKSIAQIQNVITSGQMAGMSLSSKSSITADEKSKVLSWIQSGATK